MKTIASTSLPEKASADGPSKASRWRPFLTPARDFPPAGSSPNIIALQSTASCACGGGCPRCQQNQNHRDIQTKLTVSTPGDVYEQEADRVAEQVTRMTASSDSALPVARAVPNVARHSWRRSSQPHDVPAWIDDVLRSPGQQLDASTRAFMEPRFGHDFGDVRVHADRQATASAIGVGAHAYTVGDHIVFGAGEYRPETNEGRRLLAHELTHTLQAGAGVVRRSAISDNIQAVWDATPTLDALLARLSQSDVQRAQGDADIDTKIATLLAGRTDDLWLAQRIRQGRLGMTAGARPVEAHFIQGSTTRRALVFAGTHGSEVQGVEVARRLLADLATQQPVYTVIIVPSLFPDNAVTRTREGATPTNRNLPPADQDLAAATRAGRGTPIDAQRRAILPENIMLMHLVESFSPERVISIHGTRHSGAAGVFYDPVGLSAADLARARTDAREMAFLQVPIELQGTYEGEERLRQAEERNYVQLLSAMANRDEPLALAAASQIETATTAITGRERRPMDRESDTTVDTAERTRRRGHPSVPGNVGPSGNIDTTFWSGSTPRGVSWGQYLSRRGVSTFTVEPPLNLRTGDYPSSLDSQVDAAERRVELQAYADAVRTILLGR